MFCVTLFFPHTTNRNTENRTAQKTNDRPRLRAVSPSLRPKPIPTYDLRRDLTRECALLRGRNRLKIEIIFKQDLFF